MILLALFAAAIFAIAGLWSAGSVEQKEFSFDWKPGTNSPAAEQEVNERLAGQTGLFHVAEQNTVFRATVTTGPLPNNSWVAPELELVDFEGAFLMSFGKELWHETGYDEGHWDESDTEMQSKFTLDGPADYNLQLLATGTAGSTFRLRLERLRGSSLPATAALVIMLVLAVGLNEIRRQSVFRLLNLIFNREQD
jgi:hypothetical protein